MIRGSVPDILRQPLRRTSSLHIRKLLWTLGIAKILDLDFGASLWQTTPPSPSPAINRRGGHQILAWCDYFRSAAFSRLHTRTRSEWWSWPWRPSSFCSLVLVCPAPALALLKNLPCASDPTAVCIARFTLFIIHRPCILVIESQLCAISIPVLLHALSSATLGRSSMRTSICLFPPHPPLPATFFQCHRHLRA